ncbi:MAG: hypothetical protein WC542_14245 [Paludibacter sp.]
MKKNKNGWKIVGYVLIVLFALAFLYSRIRRPLYHHNHNSTIVQKNESAG